ncbi:hypothetical protein WA1_51195 [Scytonema hofmannii PCC 7110]|uniref:D-alanyl-D-alanine carboxypeptidase-like core domain-containing protein n=1 Tax=Scytonema hofmannii PCC 7110 TaxID=128403 RepID=A0A139WQ64_9CYAN|nr:M15 family metallopeptidase [Scytonema hofmannii]KYC34573.1 hypothetical protein WA1_51195 [Scytonema hofmannii PCC 7110]
MKMRFISDLWTRWRFILVIALVVIGVVLNIYALTQFLKQKPSVSQSASNIEQNLKVNSSPTTNISPKVVTLKKLQPSASTKKKLGHFYYLEGDPNQMMIIGSYGPGEYQRFERLAPEAASAFMKLIYAARDQGVWIIPVSGYRSVAAQEKLFEAQIQRLGSPEAAAKLSAPPGYSEHHTGYAIDLADGHFPKQDITHNFASTDAFKWLNFHAKEFGFELSFQENNSQGVSYEPWHWRFIGSPKALLIFKNRN